MRVPINRREEFLESVGNMARGTASSVFLHPLLFGMFYLFVGWEFSSPQREWLALATLGGFSLARAFAWRSIPDRPRAYLFIGCVWGTALFWGTMVGSFIHYRGVDEDTLVLMMAFTGICSIGAASFYLVPWVGFVFLGCMVGPPVASFMVMGWQEHPLVLGMLMAFGLILAFQIYARYHAYKRMIRDRQFLSMIMDSIPGHLSILDRKSLRYIRVSERMAVAHKTTGQFFVGKVFGFSGLNPEFVSVVTQWMQGDLEKFHGEYQLQQGDDLRWFLVVGRRFGPEGQFVLLLSMDIDERKQVEEKLALEQAKGVHTARLAALGEMAAGIAHEINNPLAIIDGYAERLQGILEREGNQKGGETSGKIRAAVARASKIINGLRTFSRQGEGEKPVEVSVASVFSETIEFASERLKAKGVQLRQSGDWSVLVKVVPTQLSQVILNLLNNAIAASDGKESSWIHLSVSPSPTGEVLIKVADSGGGISKKNQMKLFQPFFTTKAVGVGTGLGLSISKGLVEQWGGSLFYSGTETQTEFTITLPLANKARLAA